MKLVKISIEADIKSGFDLIHIDPSLGFKHGLSKIDVREVVYELINFCESIKTKEIIYEIGTEEQVYSSSDDVESELKVILKDLDDKQMFEKDDDVGFVFSEIIKLIEKLKERTE